MLPLPPAGVPPGGSETFKLASIQGMWDGAKIAQALLPGALSAPTMRLHVSARCHVSDQPATARGCGALTGACK